MTEEERQALIRNNSNIAMGEYLGDHSAAVWQQYSDGAEELGSAVCIEIAERYFLASAAHNFEVTIGGGKVTLLSARSPSLLPLVELAHNYSQYGKSNALDLAWVEIDPTLANTSGLKAIPLTRVQAYHSIEPTALEGNYEVTGFPAALTETHGKKTTIHFFVYNTIPGKHSRPGTDQLLLNYSEEARVQYKTVDQGLVAMPEPGGISGGGIWYIPTSDPSRLWGPSLCYLIGIATHYLSISRQIKGVPIHHWLAFLLDDHPELQPHIDPLLAQN
jgi:hypothetical protein